MKSTAHSSGIYFLVAAVTNIAFFNILIAIVGDTFDKIMHSTYCDLFSSQQCLVGRVYYGPDAQMLLCMAKDALDSVDFKAFYRYANASALKCLKLLSRNPYTR